MSSRYPPPEQSESRFATRDRSPPRFTDRRASGAYSSGPQTSRVADTNYRSFDSNTHHREPPREPPRGPKAYVDPPRGNFQPRGRGFSRGDFRDREYRDPRDGVIARGGSHRDWSHRASADTRDRRISPPGRGRTRSPPRRDYGRDSRDLTSRDIDRDRPRPDVLAEVPHSAGFRGRPSFRARGRGDWDHGHRGRGSFADERDSFRVRSTSGDRNRDRNPREDRDRDRDQELSRRDEDYRRPWEDKDRDSRRDPPFRPDSRNSSGANPSTPLSSTGPMSNQLNVDRSSHAYRGPSSDSSRRSSGPNVASDYGNSVKDLGRMDVTLHRPDRDRLPVQPPSPPPQAPEVPAFGSISYRQPTIEQGAPTPKKSGTSDFSASPSQTGQGTARQPPSAPKAQLLGQISSIPKVEQHSERLPLIEQKPPISRTTNDDRYLSGAVPVHPTVPSGPRLSSGDNTAGDAMSRALLTSSIKRPPTENSHSRLSGQHAGSQMAAKATSLQLVHPSRREVVAESLRQDTVAPFPSRPTHREISIPGQSSPAKVPTGPRAERSAPSIRQIVPPAPRVPPQRHVNPSWRGGQPNLTWVRPGLSQGPPQHAPRGPSIMNTVPTKRDNAGEDRAKSPPPDQEERENNDVAWPRGGSSLKDALDQAKAEGDNLHAASKERRHRSGTGSPRVEAQALPTKQASTHGPVSEGPQRAEPDTGPEDSAMDLDDDDFEVAERKFNRKLQVLEARRPPTPRHHQELLALLEECDALASAAEDLTTGVIPQLPREPAPTKIPASGLPSPKAEDDENVEMDVDHHNASPSLVRRLSPPIEGLPFLVAGPPTPLSEIEDLQDFSLHELVKLRILKQLQIQDEEVEVQYEEDKQQFAEDYRSWRWKNIELEEQEKARNDAAPPPAPVETAPVIGCAITSISGTRRVRNTSESQMEEVLKISEKTAADEELRRTHQLADRGPNHDKEAVVPDMLSVHESKAMLFVDTNNFVPGDGVLQALAFAPRKDDFTAKEHDKFIDQYILNPKRWGAIAAEIPGRNYQDCVQHYYLTKASCMYKEKEKAFLRIKKGRRGPRGPQNRAKSSNLMPAYDGNTELDPGSAAVTETGRPKRTAAPVFGATSDVEGATPAATPIRRNLVLSKVDTNGETSVEKPRRRGAGAPKEKGARRGKAVLLAAAPGPSPQKGDRDAGRGKSREPKPEAEQVLDDLESAQGLQQSQVSAMPPAQSISIENWMTRQSISVPTNLAGVQKSQQPLFEAQIPPPQHQRSGQLTSSYWSVPEHQDFQNLLGHFGTNWQAIADTMKTKSVTMVRNYYNRASQKEENEFLKKIALDADERIKRGEDMGPPPAPTTQNKRRAENTPQLPPQRPLAPSVDQLDIESESSQAQATKPVLISSPQAQTSQPRYQTLAQAEPTPTAPFSVSANQGLVNVIPRTQQQPSHQRTTSLQGPRSGFFSDERSRSLVQAQASTDSPKTQQQQRQNLAEDEASRIRRLETQQRAEALKRQQKQEFLDKLEQQHQGRQSEQVQGTMQPQPPVRNHSTPVSQPFLAPSQPTSSQVRIAPSQPLELDTRPRLGNQSQQSQFDRMQQEPSPAVRRLDPVIPGRVRQSALQSPASARIPLALSPLDENARVGSTPAMPTPAPPPRPSPAPAKRSNIMSILNDEPSEPPAPRRKAEDVPSVGPMPTQHSPTTLVQPFRPPSQLSQTHPARDAGHDRAVHVLQPQHRHSLSQSTTQPQQQHQSQQPVHVREKPAPWVAAAQRLGQQRSNYQSPVANSPQSQPAFLQPASRGSFQSIQRSHAPSPPPAPFSHSRTPSYTSGPTQLASQQQMPAHQAQQAGSQGHAAPNLQSSPYTTIQPHQTPQGGQHHMQLQIQRQQDEQRHADLQRRARQEAILQQEAAHHHQQHQQQQQQHFQQQQRSFEASRRPSEQTTFLRPKEGGSVETERSRELLVLLMREEQERKLEQTRREQGRVFTPPVYPGHGYGPPTGPQQQPGLGHGRYEERR